MVDAKAIFVDGPNAYHMGRALGILELRYASLFRILTREVGNSSSCFGKPVYVLTPEQAARKKEVLERSGFEVVAMSTENGKDDAEIVRRINTLTTDDVSEIILVSANFKDFQECLQAKSDLGIRVIIVATKTFNEEGRSMLSVDFDEMRGEMEFVDLEMFKTRLTRTPLIKNNHLIRTTRRP